MRTVTNDLDYLVARLHGRRSQLAEEERLDELCRLRSIPELASALYPERDLQAPVDLQRQLVQDLLDELSELRVYVAGAGARLLGGMLTRFQVENLKVLVRGFITQTPLELMHRHLVSLPRDLTLNTGAMASAGSLAEFARLVPKGPLRQSFTEATHSCGERPKAFFLEAALDRGYFQELLARAAEVSGEDKEAVQAMVFQEVDMFHLMLVVRGRFYYGLAAAGLVPFHLGGTRIPLARFVAMLSQPDLRGAAQHGVGRVVGALPPELKGTNEPSATADPARLEALAWERFSHLANSTFRCSPMGLGAVIGYVGLRRLEVANLLTLSEGIRAGLAVEVIRARLAPHHELEAVHV